MNIKQHYISIASLVSAILCPLPFIFFLDEFSRESEMGAQVLGFAMAGMGALVYCAFLLPILLFFYFISRRNGQIKTEESRIKLDLVFCLIACTAYFIIGLVTFRGMIFGNTAFYLISRFAPYFLSIFFCFLAIFFISPNRRVFNKILLTWCVPAIPPVVVLGEKLFCGRITGIDLCYCAVYFILFATYAGLKNRKREE